jgi:hypothetical protein
MPARIACMAGLVDASVLRGSAAALKLTLPRRGLLG